MKVIPRPCISDERVRWADVDLVGIMRFSAFTRLVENAEQEMWRAAGLPFSQLFDKPDVLLPRRQLSIEYTAPARIDDALSLITYVSRVGETSLTFNVDIMSADCTTMYATAAVVVVCVNAANFGKQPLPASVRAALAPFVMTSELARAAVGDRGAQAGYQTI